MSNYLIISFNFFLAGFLWFYKDKISKYLNVIDIPNKRKVHKQAIPLMGGFFLLVPLIFNLSFGMFFENQSLFIFKSSFQQLLFLLLLIFVFLIGFYDDKFHLDPQKRLISLSIIFFVFISIYPEYIITEIDFIYLDLSLKLKYFSIFFTILCFLLFLNACNMIDGINGFALIYFIVFFLYLSVKSLFSIDIINYLLLFLVLCLFLNLRNKIFLGDSGVYILSFILTILIINFYKNNLISVEEILSLMLVPGLDMLRLFIQRLKCGKNPFTADRNHLHHLILNRVKNQYYTLFICLIITFLPITIFNYFIY